MAIRAFREAYTSADVLDSNEFSNFEARQVRYGLYWAFYENTQYRNIHSWATAYRNTYGLYRYVRGIYNPVYRLGEFWKGMVWGGALSRQAEEKGAIPISTENDALRPAIARLWRDSNWAISKDILTLYGAILGDVGLRVVDDVNHEQVRLEVVHPGTIKDVTVDPHGFVKGYEIEEQRKIDGQAVIYREVASRDGQNVIYQTYRDGKPWAWNGIAAEWSEPYGFVPFVILQHNNVGLEWGWSELHPLRGKIHEADDIASKTGDQIRKMVDAPWLFSGVDRPRENPRTSRATETKDRPEPGREEMPALYGPAGASATPLVAPLDLEASLSHIAGLLKEMERDYPELQMDIWTAQGDVSGRALRVARQRAESKVVQRREGYDSAIVRAGQMAVAIGGMRGYGGYEGFGLESYAAGALDHTVASRQVFAQDPLDLLEVLKLKKEMGVPDELLWREMGYTDEQIAEMKATDEYRARTAMTTLLDAGGG